MNKITSIILVLLLNFYAFASAEPMINARTAIIVDYHSDKVLYEYEPDIQIYPASMTKIMTTIIAFDLLKKNSISLDDITIKAEFNNYAINTKCQQQENIAVIPLDILIVAKPLSILEEPILSLPVYISLLNDNDEILEIQYFSVSGVVNKNNESNIFIESDITDRLQIVTQQLETTQLVLGFMLDKEKRNLLN